MNIKFMQSGGGMPPFTYYQPVMVNNASSQRVSQETSAKESSSKSNKKDDDDDGLSNMIKLVNALKGLPSDLDLLQKDISQILRFASLGMSPDKLAPMYAKIAFDIKKAEFSQSKYLNSEEKATKEESLSEMAITPSGGLLVMNKQKKNPQMETISINEYLENKDKYTTITNGELLEYRAKYSPKNDKILDIVNNGTSLIAIDKLINQYLDQLGTLTYSTQGSVVTQQGKIVQGIEFIQQALDKAKSLGIPLSPSGLMVDGLYDAKLITKDQQIQALHALEYIKKMLPRNMKTYLLATAGSEKQVMALIENFVYSKTNKDVDFTPKLEHNQNKSKKGSSQSSTTSTEDYATDIYQNIVRGTGGTDTIFTLKDKDGHSYQTNAVSYPQFVPDSIPPRGSLSLLLSQTNLKGITKGQGYAITFGSQVLDSFDMTNVAYLDDSNAVRVLLPIKYDQGKIVPDLEFVANNKDVINKLNSKNGQKDPELIKKLQSLGLVDPYTGLPDMNKFQPYLCINGLATSQTIDNTSFVQECTKDNKDQYLSLFLNAVKGTKDNKDYADSQEFEFDDFSWWNPADYFGTDKLYTGTIFLPITENALQAGLAAGSNLKNDDAHLLQTDYNQGQIGRNMNQTSSNVLGL